MSTSIRPQTASHRPGRQSLRMVVLCVLALLPGAASVPAHAAAAPAATAAPQAIGWVGSMWPAGGSQSNVGTGSFFDIYVQVYKAGVTPPAGRGAGIMCQVRWSAVPDFGQPWPAPSAHPMQYNKDIDNNDEYKGTIGPLPAGKYEFSARCSDDNGTSWTNAEGGNARINAVSAADVCNGASGSSSIYWSGLGHNTLDPYYRSAFGAVTTAAGSVSLRLRTCSQPDNSASVRIWDGRSRSETWYPMTWETNGAYDPYIGANGSDIWRLDLAVPAQPTIYYYIFRVVNNTSGSTAYYYAGDARLYGSGWGTPTNDLNTAQSNSFQLTIYDSAYTTPAWLQEAVIYQIFPDRFRNGDPGVAHGEPVSGTSWIYGQQVWKNAWTADVCDPRAASPCPDAYSNQFYGGDLDGVVDELDYLQQLGVTTIYLNPIFRAPSNHGYDTQDYFTINPYFGTLATFNTLAAEAHARGMRLILDGVFNHVSSDSAYFDRYSRFDGSGNLTSPGGPGTWDSSGACESTASPWRAWFTFVAGPPNKCYDGNPGSLSLSYWDWAGYDSLAKLASNTDPVKDYVYDNGTSSVGPYWLDRSGFAGADGWRFDVGGDVDPGVGSGYGIGYWSGFRTATRAVKNDSAMLIEEWGNTSPWLLGSEMDSTMNYRFRSAVLSFMADQATTDNDSNSSSSSGPISPIAPSQFDLRLKAIQENYPAQAWYAMMNLMDSHDTNRVRFLLKLSSTAGDAAADARAKLKLLTIFQFTYPGAPTIYYGDEAGLAPDGVWDSGNGTWQDDPYNRQPYPWADQGRTPDADLIAHYRRLAVLRNQYPVLRTGDLTTLLADDVSQIYAYSRTGGATDIAITVLNRDPGYAHSVSLSGIPAAFNGATLYDVMNSGAAYTVSGGGISNISVSSLWGAVLVEGPLPAYDVALAAGAYALSPGGTTSLTATVTNLAGQPAADGTVVDFAITGSGGGSLPATATTSGGVAAVTFTAPAATGATQVTASSGTYAYAGDALTLYTGYAAGVSGEATQRLTIGPATLDAKAAAGMEVVKAGLGEPWATAAAFTADPTGTWAVTPPTGWRDLHLSTDGGVTQIEVRLYYAGNPAGESNLRLWWYNGTNWVPASNTGVNTADTGGYGGYVWAIVSGSSSPTLAQLTGTPLAGSSVTPTAIALAHASVSPRADWPLPAAVLAAFVVGVVALVAQRRRVRRA